MAISAMMVVMLAGRRLARVQVLKQQSAKLEAKVVSQQREAEKAERKLGAAAAKLTSLTQRNERWVKRLAAQRRARKRGEGGLMESQTRGIADAHRRHACLPAIISVTHAHTLCISPPPPLFRQCECMCGGGWHDRLTG
jgi:predicted phage gp36 major capsid-like protein